MYEKIILEQKLFLVYSSGFQTYSKLYSAICYENVKRTNVVMNCTDFIIHNGI